MSKKMNDSKIIFFSQCLYKPIIMNAESISIGLLVHIPERKEIKFIPSTSRNRILTFDDELKPEHLKLYMEYLSYEFSNENLECKFHSINLADTSPSVIEGLTKNQVNNIRFSQPEPFAIEESETYDEAIEQLARLYLYFDTPKEKRPNRDELVRMMKRRIKSTIGRDNIENAPKEDSPLNDPIPYDFKVFVNQKGYLEQIYIKVLKVDYFRFSSLISELQRLIYRAEHTNININIDQRKQNFIILSNIKEKDLSEEALKLLEDLNKKGFKVQYFEEVIQKLQKNLEIS